MDFEVKKINNDLPKIRGERGRLLPGAKLRTISTNKKKENWQEIKDNAVKSYGLAFIELRKLLESAKKEDRLEGMREALKSFNKVVPSQQQTNLVKSFIDQTVEQVDRLTSLEIENQALRAKNQLLENLPLAERKEFLQKELINQD